MFLNMQIQGKKRSKVGHLARLFNAADAFSGAKYTHKSKCQDTLAPVDNFVDNYQAAKGRLKNTFRRPFDIYVIINLFTIFGLILLIQKQ